MIAPPVVGLAASSYHLGASGGEVKGDKACQVAAATFEGPRESSDWQTLPAVEESFAKSKPPEQSAYSDKTLDTSTTTTTMAPQATDDSNSVTGELASMMTSGMTKQQQQERHLHDKDTDNNNNNNNYAGCRLDKRRSSPRDKLAAWANNFGPKLESSADQDQDPDPDLVLDLTMDPTMDLKVQLEAPGRRLNLKHYHHLVAISMLLLMGAFLVQVGDSVDCFKCSSRNGSNPACEDPFHNLNTTRIASPILPDPLPLVIYHTPCFAGKKGKEGLFPASACIKLTGTFDTTGETLVVRHCALDSGTLTQDTELARMSHCGKFQFEGDLLRGCVLACPEDACNSAIRMLGPSSSVLLVTCLIRGLLSVLLSAGTWRMRARGI